MIKIGQTGIKDGVFAEYFHVNEADANLAILPEGIDPVCAAMFPDMVVTGFHGASLRTYPSATPYVS